MGRFTIENVFSKQAQMKRACNAITGKLLTKPDVCKCSS